MSQVDCIQGFQALYIENFSWVYLIAAEYNWSFDLNNDE